MMWKTIRNTLTDEEKRSLALVIISGAALLLSLTNALGGVLPFDIAWVAIVLCGIPIVIGSAAAVIREHDIKADVLVSIALIASLCIGEYFAGRGRVYYGDWNTAGGRHRPQIAQGD